MPSCIGWPDPSRYGTLTLKRGMTSTFDLWDWFARVVEQPSLRADGEVVLIGARPVYRTGSVRGPALPAGETQGSGAQRA